MATLKLGNVRMMFLCFAVATLGVMPKSHAQSTDTIKIGLSGPFSGGSAPMGESMRHGVRLAVDEINQYVGGIHGRKIQLIERDDEANPTKGAAIADELINKEKVVATIGIVNTGVGLASIDKYQAAKIPLLVAVSTGSALTKKYAPPAAPENYIFRVAPRTDIETAFLIDYVTDHLKLQKIAILADATPYGEAGKTDLEKAMSAKQMAPVAVERFKIGDVDMTTQLEKARAAGAQVVVMYGIGPEIAAIARNKAAMNWSVPLLGGWTVSMQNFIDLSGSSGENTLMPQTFIQEASNSSRRSFITSYSEQFGKRVMPSPMSAAQGYDAMRILYNAMARISLLNGPTIKASLENIPMPIRGVVTTYEQPFTKSDHDAISPNMLMMGVVRNGKVDYAFKEDAKRSSIIRRKYDQGPSDKQTAKLVVDKLPKK